jgi:hypothetical protein
MKTGRKHFPTIPLVYSGRKMLKRGAFVPQEPRGQSYNYSYEFDLRSLFQ